MTESYSSLQVVSKIPRTIVYYNSLLSSNDELLSTLQRFFQDVYGGVWTTTMAKVRSVWNCDFSSGVEEHSSRDNIIQYMWVLNNLGKYYD